MPQGYDTDIAPSRLTYLPVVGEVDGRTRPAIAFKQAVLDFVSDLGGEDNVSRAQLELIRRCAGLAVLAGVHEAQLVAGEKVDAEAYTSLVNSQGRALVRLGLKRSQKDVTPSIRGRMGLDQ